MPQSHPDLCCCSACLDEPARSTSDPESPDPPGQGTATMPVYSSDQVINALRTSDGAWASIAWAGDQVSYSIGTGALSPGQPEYSTEYSGYVVMSQAMEAAAAEAFELWDELIAIDLVENTDNPAADIVFNYSSATGNSTYAARSFGGSSGGRADYGIIEANLWFADSWWTHDEDSDLYQGGYGVSTYLHEIGHALGISHPGNYNGSASFDGDATHFQDTRAYTVMSYFDAGDNGSGTDHIGTGGRSYGAVPLLHRF